ncbi:GNAT family N-acetyltransferase [Glaciecola siphonariae]|uniref:GNAT family N-acetyltransferase n=1 Tax=Glaciecola siphonariae TaxID=521012 RepID=A0ABV9LXP5_9ALTE
MTSLHFVTTLVDYANSRHATDLIYMLQAYAKDPMGGGQAVPVSVTERLIHEMSTRSYVFSILVYAHKDAAEISTADLVPVAFANCIESFSTFKGRAVINVHDFAVLPAFRGRDLSKTLMDAIELEAEKRNACKITLEVLEGNIPAQQAYIKCGFKAYELDPEMGRALFWEKPL